MNKTMTQFIESLNLKGKAETARTYENALQQFSGWLESKGLDPLKATLDDLRAFQRWLSEDYKTGDAKALARVSQATRLAGIKSYYKWLARRNLIVADVARKLVLPRIRSGLTDKDYLSLQEATAFVQTQASNLKKYAAGSHRWAKELQELALICIALATGRRRSSLLRLTVADLNFERNEVRIEREKGKSGRVLPVAAWAMLAAKEHVEKGRPSLNWHPKNDFLFVGEDAPQLSEPTYATILKRIHAQTVEQNPDLDALEAKNITSHSLRVSFATMLFSGGCNIRSINELMDHESLSTTAKYTPILLEDLRRACKLAHPRA